MFNDFAVLSTLRCISNFKFQISDGRFENAQFMTIRRTFITVTVAALTGMVMGGVFGFFSSKLAPDFFRHILIWQDVEPAGFATFCGATIGVLLGGGLGCFAVIIQFILDLRKKP